eukprot:g5946.t1
MYRRFSTVRFTDTRERQKEIDARLLEEERQRLAEEEARRQREEEEERRAAAEARRQREEEEARQRAREESELRARAREEEARQQAQAEGDARARAEAQAQAKADAEDARRRAEEEAAALAALEATGEWTEHVDPTSGATYYYNSASGRTCWEKPEGYRPPAPAPPEPTPAPEPAAEPETAPAPRAVSTSAADAADDENLARIRERLARLNIPQATGDVDPALDWFEVFDDATGLTAYYHRPRDHLQWDRPSGWVRIVTAKFSGGSRKIALDGKNTSLTSAPSFRKPKTTTAATPQPKPQPKPPQQPPGGGNTRKKNSASWIKPTRSGSGGGAATSMAAAASARRRSLSGGGGGGGGGGSSKGRPAPPSLDEAKKAAEKRRSATRSSSPAGGSPGKPDARKWGTNRRRGGSIHASAIPPKPAVPAPSAVAAGAVAVVSAASDHHRDSPVVTPPAAQQFVRRSTSGPNGPWTALPSVACNNPSPALADLGGGGGGGGGGKPREARLMCTWNIRRAVNGSSSFAGPWGPAVPVDVDAGSPRGDPRPGARWEDPFLWQDKRGHWHILAHVFADGRRCGDSDPASVRPSCNYISGHAFSRDGLTNWTVSPTEPYSFSVQYDDGTTGLMSTRERPKLLFDPETREPTHLYNAVAPMPPGACVSCLKPRKSGDARSCIGCKTCEPWGHQVYTMVAPLRQAKDNSWSSAASTTSRPSTVKND